MSVHRNVRLYASTKKVGPIPIHPAACTELTDVFWFLDERLGLSWLSNGFSKKKNLVCADG